MRLLVLIAALAYLGGCAVRVCDKRLTLINAPSPSGSEAQPASRNGSHVQ